MVDPPRHDVVGRQDAERHGADHGEQRAPDGDLQGDDHFRGVQPPVREVGREEILDQREDIARLGNQGHGAHFRPPPRPDEKRQRDGPTHEAQQFHRALARRRQSKFGTHGNPFGKPAVRARREKAAREPPRRRSVLQGQLVEGFVNLLDALGLFRRGISALASSLLFSRNSSS